MPYTQTVWVDNTTLVDAAKMNKIEAGIASLSAPAPSTTPPASPADGDIWYLPFGNGVAWQFRYNAGSASTYKWEFVGGAIAVTTYGGGTAVAVAATWYNYGVGVVAPRAGEYFARVKASFWNQTVGAAACYLNAAVGSGSTTGVLDGDGITVPGNAIAGGLETAGKVTVPTAGTGVYEIVQAAAIPAQPVNRIVELTPIRVS